MTAAVEFAVSFEDLIVDVRQNGERERILGPVTGCVRSGQVNPHLTTTACLGATSPGLVPIHAQRMYNALICDASHASLAGVVDRGTAYEAAVMVNALRGAYNFSTSPVANILGEGVHVGGTVTWNGQSPQDVDARVLAFVDFQSPDTIPITVTCWEVLAYTIKVRVTFLSASGRAARASSVAASPRISCLCEARGYKLRLRVCVSRCCASFYFVSLNFDTYQWYHFIA